MTSLPRRNQIGKYKIVSRLGSGGMGTVHKAIDQESGETVALKILSPEAASQPTALARFRHEAELGLRLRHPHIITLYQFGEEDGRFYLVMEYVEGIDLAKLIHAEGRLAPELARHIVIQLGQALDYVHRRGIIHRDIKPSNILLVNADADSVDEVTAKLGDLGLALFEGNKHRITRDGYTVGTIDYMAPEQARNSRGVDIRSDIYALGCTFYHMLTGAAPFAEGTLLDRVQQHAEAPPPDPRDVNPELAEYLALACRRMMAKKPKDRFQTPAELLHELGWEPASASSQALTTKGVTQSLFERAQEVLHSSHFAYGIPLLEDCCRREPSNLEFRQALRDALREEARAPGADSLRNRVWAVWARARFGIALLFRRHASVLYWGERLLARDTNNIWLPLQMATAADALSAHVLSEWLLRQADRAEARDSRVLRRLAFIAEKREDIPAALEFWEAILRLDRDSAEARHKMRDLSVRGTISHGRYEEHLQAPKSPRRK